MKYDTIKDAAYAWIQTFDAYPQWMIEKIAGEGLENLYEITPPSSGDRVYVYEEKEYGEIVDVKTNDEGNTVYEIDLDNGMEGLEIEKDDFEVEREYGFLPMWGTMWSFHESIDYEYYFGDSLGDHLQEMADCGFRIYEYSDRDGNEETFFGIDGVGYDFYENHWIPLYKSRGLKWHKDAA